MQPTAWTLSCCTCTRARLTRRVPAIEAKMVNTPIGVVVQMLPHGILIKCLTWHGGETGDQGSAMLCSDEELCRDRSRVCRSRGEAWAVLLSRHKQRHRHRHRQRHRLDHRHRSRHRYGQRLRTRYILRHRRIQRHRHRETQTQA